MRFEKIKKNQIVKNKVNRQLYAVIGLDEKSATLAPYDAETEEPVYETEDLITMTAKNAIAFRLVSDPNPKEVPAEYTVENGTLMKGSEPATQQGQLVVHEILSKGPGYLILKTSKQGGHNIFITKYVVEKDLFAEIENLGSAGTQEDVTTKITVIEAAKTENTSLIVYDITETRKEKKEDGSVEENTYFIRSEAIATGYAPDVRRDAFDFPAAEAIKPESTRLVRSEDGIITLYAPIYTRIGEDGKITRDKSEKGIDGNLRITLSDSHLDSTILDIRAEIISATRYFKGDDFIRTWNAIYLESDLLAKTDDLDMIPSKYKYLVDITRKENETVYALASDAYEIMNLTKISTPDRGYIFAVDAPVA